MHIGRCSILIVNHIILINQVDRKTSRSGIPFAKVTVSAGGQLIESRPIGDNKKY